MLPLKNFISGYLLIMCCAGIWLADRFFPDAKWYLNTEHNYAPDYLHRYLLTELPGYHVALSLFAMALLANLVRRVQLRYYFCFLHPYSIMLLMSPMKEQILGIGALVLAHAMHRRRRIGLRSSFMQLLMFLCALLLLTIRKIYLPLILIVALMRIKLVQLVGLILFLTGLVLVVASAEITQIALILESRAHVNHVVREYFSGLCLEEKESFYPFLQCWLGSTAGLPFHPDMLSINYVVFLSFQIMWVFFILQLVNCPAQFKLLAIGSAVSLNFLLFWWGPTLGASTRYFLPVLWLLSALSIRFSPTRAAAHLPATCQRLPDLP